MHVSPVQIHWVCQLPKNYTHQSCQLMWTDPDVWLSLCHDEPYRKIYIATVELQDKTSGKNYVNQTPQNLQEIKFFQACKHLQIEQHFKIFICYICANSGFYFMVHTITLKIAVNWGIVGRVKHQLSKWCYHMILPPCHHWILLAS